MSKLLCCIFLSFYVDTFSQNTLVSNGNIFEGEPYLVINPQNQQHLVAAWMGYQLNQKICIKSAVSFNGGNNWSIPIVQNHEIATNSSADVSLAYNSTGDLFMCYIDFDNELFTNGKIIIRKSVNGGLSWSTSTEVISITDCPTKLCVDRPWMVIDKSGGIHDGTIYVTSMNAKQPTLVTPPYFPYLSVSKNAGLSFEAPRYLDTINYLAGSSIPQVMASPEVSASGTFYAIYPSYETSQSLFPRYLLAQSNTQGLAINHSIAYQGLNLGAQNDLLKRGSLLKTNPSNSLHLAYFFLSEINDGADVYFTETTDAGITWTSMQRINQDPIANGKLQDLLWADFDVDGDLLVCWRDRRNGLGTSYAENTEIYAAVRPKDSLNFNLDYPISSQQIQHDQVLTGSGNDFMHTCLINDTAYAVWGDVRTGTLKIYLNKWNIFSQVSAISEIPTNETIQLFPNPSNLLIQLPQYLIGETYAIFSSNGNFVFKKELVDEFIDISGLAKGGYTLQIQKDKFLYGAKFIKD